MEPVYKNSVCMLGVKLDDCFKVIGTGIFLFHKGKYLILTANHVLKELTDRNIFIYYQELELNPGKQLRTHGVRKKSEETVFYHSSFDIGVIEISIEMLNLINFYNHQKNIDLTFISSNHIEETNQSRYISYIYGLIGFPAILTEQIMFDSKNKTPQVRHGLYSLGMDRSNELSGSFNENSHIAVDFDNIEYISGFKEYEFPQDTQREKGMSGGLIEKVFKTTNNVSVIPSGIILEADPVKKYIIGLRLKFVFDWLDFWIHKLS